MPSLLDAQSEGADPSIRSNDYDPYLRPGRHAPADLIIHPEVRRRRGDTTCSSPAHSPPAPRQVRKRVLALEARYADVPKVRHAPRCAQPRARGRHRG